MLLNFGVAFRIRSDDCHQLHAALHLGDCITVDCLTSGDRLSFHIDFALTFARHQADHEVRISY